MKRLLKRSNVFRFFLIGVAVFSFVLSTDVCFCKEKAEFKIREIPGSEFIKEVSGIAALSNGYYLLVDDYQGILMCTPDSKMKTLVSASSDKRFKELEGVCVSNDEKRVYVISESTSKVFEFPLEVKKGSMVLGKFRELGCLPRIGTNENQSWEGITLLCENGKEILVAGNQSKPKSLGYFELPGLKQISVENLPGEAKDELGDISDLAADQRTGNLFLLSDVTRTIVELARSGNGNYTLKRKIKIPADVIEHPEAICLESNGDLTVTGEGKLEFLRIVGY